MFAFRLRLQTDRGAIVGEAQAAWAGEPDAAGGGVPNGVVFTDIAPDQLQALWELLVTKGWGHRVGLRLPVDLAVSCLPKGQPGPPLQGGARDMSCGGLLLRLPQAMPPGTGLELTLQTPAGPLTIAGEVVWMAPPESRTPGGPIPHGVRFTALDWAALLALGRLLVDSRE